jgi:hypothetical protein
MEEPRYYAQVFLCPELPPAWFRVGGDPARAIAEARWLCGALPAGRGRVYLYPAPPREDGAAACRYWVGFRRGWDGRLIILRRPPEVTRKLKVG